ncbi:MAG: membrane protein insertase YidC [Pseudomonas sp.]|jgi:YidC/Oxa1 family membrane protein insertase|nr:membrane protein insertase YidC [Pseudomonas sp.]MDD2224314.1 membrane protein insertase YidC [Pseudomonas sp.]MDY0414345.1 membrane protein insertase YidC [Pseudomonas sp.]NLO54900.1 membrane protein insertase YidC [Gammaproteobacteria bacterium]
MDIQRTILLVALAVVSYMMVLQWNQDYGQAPVTAAITQSSTVNQNASSNNQAINNTASTADNDDVPVAINERAQDPTLVSNVVSNDLIYVQTDVLQLAIDPNGGDIVELKLSQYPRHASNPDIPLQLFENSNERVYVAQSGLVGANGPDARASGRPLYSAIQQNFTLQDGQEQLNVDLSFQENGVNYTKRFTLHRGLSVECSAREISQRKLECINQQAYQIDLTYLVDNQSEREWKGNLFAQLKRDGQGDPSSTTATGTATYLGAALWTADEPYKKLSMSNMDDKKFNQAVEGGWVAWLQHYFVTAWVANPEQTNQVTTRKDSKGNYIIGYTSPAMTVAAGEHAQASATLYAGPKIQSHLKNLSPGLELTVDYGFLWFIAQPIFWLLGVIHSILGNWGWSIIVLTILIKLAFFPLSAASYKSMARMRAVAPRMAALKEEHAGDRQKLSQGMMELYKKEKINPLGGCLPILVQMPVFLSLYWVLLESVEMRQAPFMFWLTDLSSKDPFFILPIIMGLSMFVQQQLNPTPPDPMQAKVMKLLPIIFTFFFLWFPAGLVLYWVVNNLLSIGQQWYITRKIEKSMAAANAS